MFIRQFVRRDYRVVHPYDGVQSIKDYLCENIAVVVMDNRSYLGLLTLSDINIKRHTLIIDCIRSKSSVSPDQPVADALQIMWSEHTEVIPVFKDEQFTGLVYKNDLFENIHQTLEEHKNIVNSVVHDLKTPISNIVGLTSLLKSSLTQDSNKELVTYAEDACNQAIEIINELLYIAKIETQKETITADSEIYSLLKSCLKSMRSTAASKEIELVDGIPESKLYLAVNPIKLRRAVSNLISNAIKFTPNKGEIVISCIQNNDNVLIKIKDNGIGIPTSLQPVIFDKFTSAGRQGTYGENSTGLGMYITKQIIELQGGKIWFESEEFKGTTFYIELLVPNKAPSPILHKA